MRERAARGRACAVPVGQFLGTDILPPLVAHARKVCARPDWTFHTTKDFEIPAPEASADFVCFLSLFTHLLHEDIYRYLAAAKRVLKPSGRIVFSYLDFAVPSHWAVFEQTLADRDPDRVLNQFISKDGIASWCQHLRLEISAIHDGHVPWINLVKSFHYVDGRKASGIVEFGQSVCVLTHAPEPPAPANGA